jgi:hypothetical protein
MVNGKGESGVSQIHYVLYAIGATKRILLHRLARVNQVTIQTWKSESFRLADSRVDSLRTNNNPIFITSYFRIVG